MSYYYKIGYGHHEYSHAIELIHECKFTHKQIQKMINEGVIELFNEVIPPQTKPYSRWQFYMKEFFEDDKIINWLIERKGFKKVEYTVDYQCWYEDILSGKKENKSIGRYLNKHGIKKKNFNIERW